MYPVPPTQSHGAHGILCEVVAQFKFWILQEPGELSPERERIVASLAERAGWKRDGLRCFDPATDIIQQWPGSFLSPGMAHFNTKALAASFRIDGKQLIHSRDDRSRNGIAGVELYRFKKQPPRMSPTCGTYYSGPSDLIVCRVAICLENAFELPQKLPRSIPSPTEAKIKHDASSGPAVLP